MIDKNNIPTSWEVVKLGEVCEILMGQSPASSTYNKKGIGLPFFQGKKEFTELHPVVEKWCSEPNKIAEPDDILLSVRAPVGATNIANQKCCIGRGLAAIRFKENNLYIFYFLKLIEKQLDEKGTGTTFRAISGEVLKATEIPLPPEKEINRIVSKIEELFTELDKGIETLKTTQQQLKVYRQAVLKWAFEGRLTMSELGKGGLKDDKMEKKILKSSNPKNHNADKGDLPEGWTMIPIKDFADCLDHKRKPVNKTERQKRIGDIPYYGANGRTGWINDYLFNEPLILVVEDETFVGRELPFSYKITGKSWVNNHAHILKPRPNMNIDFLNYQLSFYPFLPLTTGTTGRKKLTKDKLINAIIKCCPLKEQIKIVHEIESRLSVCDKMEETIANSLQQAEALRLSILKKAFEGKLVEQNAEDEPAAMLLSELRLARLKDDRIKKVKRKNKTLYI